MAINDAPGNVIINVTMAFITTVSTTELEHPPDENSQFVFAEGELITVVVMLALFALFGIVGNALAFYIYFKKRDKTTSNVFILALAATDFIVCLLVVPFTIVAELLEYEFIFDFPCKLYMFCITSNIPLSAFIMAAIAFDRYCCICHPFLHVLTVQRARNTCVVLTFIAGLMGVITALNFGVYKISSVQVNVSDINVAINSTTDVLDTTYYELANATLDINGSIANVPEYQTENETIIFEEQVEYVGVCMPSEMLLSLSFVTVYQKLYAGMFLLILIAMAILYALIYRSIVVRRRWRSKRKRMSCYTSVNGVETIAEETQLTALNGNNVTDIKKSKRPFQSRQAAIREKTLYANVKTAAMLFVVSVVFVISFLPSWLMGLQYIPINVIVYNMYFLNNLANPIIYAFMNRAFRDDLRALIKGCK